ncbi:hypothetical protein C7T79_16320 [Xanthomonas oryzae pv. oryzicola]|nr:hypothetical protein C7T79_16320 [Xanthomonas oryzae pv. oryzicola]
MHWELLGFAPPGWLAWDYIRKYVPNLQVPFVGISPFFFRRGAWSVSVAGSERPCMPPLTGAWAGGLSAAGWR